MSETITIRCPLAEKTHFTGKSLSQSLYGIPVTISLEGDLGAGKTTFIQGFAEGLGVEGHVTSPTYALENRYETDQYGAFLHLDLYRLDEKAARELLDSSDDHSGIRCIEWGRDLIKADIHIELKEEGKGRLCSVTFRDTKIPTQEQVDAWRKQVRIPTHINAHCDVVADVAVRLASHLMDHGVIVRREALRQACRLHDLLRFIDFKENQSHITGVVSDEDVSLWQEYKERFQGMRHEQAVATFLREEGYDTIATIVEPHGLPSPIDPHTIEQKLLFYADKRVALDQVVTVQERFEDFAKRYGGGEESPLSKQWQRKTEEVESDLFPEGVPF